MKTIKLRIFWQGAVLMKIVSFESSAEMLEWIKEDKYVNASHSYEIPSELYNELSLTKKAFMQANQIDEVI